MPLLVQSANIIRKPWQIPEGPSGGSVWPLRRHRVVFNKSAKRFSDFRPFFPYHFPFQLDLKNGAFFAAFTLHLWQISAAVLDSKYSCDWAITAILLIFKRFFVGEQLLSAGAAWIIGPPFLHQWSHKAEEFAQPPAASLERHRAKERLFWSRN